MYLIIDRVYRCCGVATGQKSPVFTPDLASVAVALIRVVLSHARYRIESIPALLESRPQLTN